MKPWCGRGQWHETNRIYPLVLSRGQLNSSDALLQDTENNSATNYTIIGLFHLNINALTYTIYLHDGTRHHKSQSNHRLLRRSRGNPAGWAPAALPRHTELPAAWWHPTRPCWDLVTLDRTLVAPGGTFCSPKPSGGYTRSSGAAGGLGQWEHPWARASSLPKQLQPNQPCAVVCSSREPLSFPGRPAHEHPAQSLLLHLQNSFKDVFPQHLPRSIQSQSAKILLSQTRGKKAAPEGHGGGSARARCRRWLWERHTRQRGIPSSMCRLLIRAGPGDPRRA